jgi:drug/metabolite transporter (DMT)-like permease
MQTIGTLALAIALLALGRWPDVTLDAVPWGLGLAVLGASSLFLLYRGLALGPIAVVSPIVASYSAFTVILVVVLLGERLSVEQAAAIGAVFVGVLLATADVRTIAASVRRPLPGVPISLVATIGFACWGTLFAAGARDHDGMTLVILNRAAGAAILAAAVVALRSPRPGDTRASTLALLATVGVFDTLANVLFMLGIQGGNAAITVTGSGLYPLLPALMGIVRHGERLAPNQYLGIAIVVGGLFALGLRA